MWSFDYSSINSISKKMEENGLSMSKKFGQNFLISAPVLDRIAGLAGINSDSNVWEIGPGLGALTSRLVSSGANVTCFEIDHGFCRILRDEAFGDCSNFTLIEGDALKLWKTRFNEMGKPDVICANLPYNVGSVLIASFIENRCLPEKMVFTLQSEVVQRICSGNGDDEYSGFSILTGIDYENHEAMKIKSGCFWPAPNVDSSVVVMERRQNGLVPEELAASFIKTTRVLFSQRRKTVRNNLKALGLPSKNLDRALEAAGIDTSARAEVLTIGQILKLTEALQS